MHPGSSRFSCSTISSCPKKVSPIRRNQCRFTTSHYPCSAAPSPKRARHAGVRGHSGVRRCVARGPTYEPRPPSPPRMDIAEITRQPRDQSSVSDGSLEHYTKHVLLGREEQGIWDCVPPCYWQ